MKKLLYFVYVWPEASSSAAGVRCAELMDYFQSQGWQITLASNCAENSFSSEFRALGHTTLALHLNNSSADQALRETKPDLVLFDRFVMEEQFGWKIREFFPAVPTVIDTQDIHFVRRNRETLVKQRHDYPGTVLADPEILLSGDIFQREIAAFLRSDGVLVLSKWEDDFLRSRLPFLIQKILWFPLLGKREANHSVPSYDERRDLCFLGNYRHGPNLDGFHWFVEEIWKKLPNRSCRLLAYGAYPPKSVSDLHGKWNIHFAGPIEDHRAKLKTHRALVAPLRYGAGMKGKVMEAWSCGTPVLGTPMAFEGMWFQDSNPPLFQDISTFEKVFSSTFDSPTHWNQAQEQGFQAVQEFQPVKHLGSLEAFLGPLLLDLEAVRKRDVLAKILNAQTLNSMKYFSRWIESKNRKPES